MRSRKNLVSETLPFHARRQRLTSRNDSQGHWGWRSIARTLAPSPAAPTHFLDQIADEATQKHDGKSATGDGQCCVGRDAYFLVDREQEKGQEVGCHGSHQCQAERDPKTTFDCRFHASHLGRTALSWYRFQAVRLLQVTTAGTQSHGCRCVPHPELQHAAASEEQNRVPESLARLRKLL